MEFLGYRIGIDYCHRGTGSYIGTRPSKASVQIIGISVHLIGIRRVELPHSPAFGGQGRVVPPPDCHEGVSHRFSGLASDASGHPHPALEAAIVHELYEQLGVILHHRVHHTLTGAIPRGSHARNPAFTVTIPPTLV